MTPSLDEEVTVNFLVLSDWGRCGDAIQRAVADGMATVAATDAPEFVIACGDNFYEAGVESVDDPHWQASFENV